MKIDSVSIDVVKHLRDGRKSFGEIARALGVSENTVRSRVVKMKENGFLDVVGLTDPTSLPGHTLAVVAVKLRTVELVAIGEKMSRLRGVVSVGVVTGQFDLILMVLLNKEFGLLEFFTEELAVVSDELQSTETFIVYKGFNLKVPYVL